VTCASEVREFVHRIFKTRHSGVLLPYIREALAYIIIPLLDFAFSSEPKLL
jgi:hypothetical protein